MSDELNQERLLRAIRALQLVQRTNLPKTSVFKAATRALAPLMVEYGAMPPIEGKPRKRAQSFAPPGVAGQQVGTPPGNNTGTLAGNADIEGMGGDAILERTRA